jgi:hypothetical protein
VPPAKTPTKAADLRRVDRQVRHRLRRLGLALLPRPPLRRVALLPAAPLQLLAQVVPLQGAGVGKVGALLLVRLDGLREW